MRNIPGEYAKRGLNNNALDAIKVSQYDHDEELFNNDFILKKVHDTLDHFNNQYHLASAKNLKLIKTLESNFDEVIEADKVAHKKIRSTNEKYIAEASENLNPTRLNYIKNLITLYELNNLESLYNDEVKELSFLNSEIFKLFNNLNGRFHINLKNREKLYNLNCPACGNSMRLRQDIMARVKCTKCKYSFIVDNTMIDNLEDKNSVLKAKNSFIRKLQKIIAIIKK
jgi:transposase-like protein